MKSIFGLLVALTGLFIVWLWATGRAKAAWDAIVSGNAGSLGIGGGLNVPSVSLTPVPNAGGWDRFSSFVNVPSLIQVTPPSILQYEQSIGQSNSYGTPPLVYA